TPASRQWESLHAEDSDHCSRDLDWRRRSPDAGDACQPARGASWRGQRNALDRGAARPRDTAGPADPGGQGAVLKRRLVDETLRPTAARLASRHLDRGVEHIAGAALGLDQPGLARIGLELAAQAQDLDVDAAIEHFLVVHAARGEELLAAEHVMR